MVVEKISHTKPVNFPIHQKRDKEMPESSHEKPLKHLYEGGFLEEIFEEKPRSKWSFFGPLLVVFAIAGAILFLL